VGKAADDVRNAIEADLRLEECLLTVVPTFLACEENARLAPEACRRLGYDYRAAPSCGEY